MIETFYLTEEYLQGVIDKITQECPWIPDFASCHPDCDESEIVYEYGGKALEKYRSYLSARWLLHGY